MSSKKRPFDAETNHECLSHSSSSPSPSSPPSAANCSSFTMEPTPLAAKRFQSHRIHTEAHNRTVDLLMNAQRLLQRQQQQHPHEHEHEHEQLGTADSGEKLSSEQERTYTQRPFW